MINKNRRLFSRIGPGIVVAATGIGAGDLIAASVAGARYGTVILWAAVLGAVMKFAMNEGLARWQLVTGTTMLEGWIHRLPNIVSGYFLFYLLIWSFVVAGALIAACGLAAHALFPYIPVPAWGVAHSLAAAVLVIAGRYRLLEPLMKFFVALMLAVILACAVLVAPDWREITFNLLRPTVPQGSVVFILGVMGGVGGSVTMLSYGYWIREKGWRGKESLSQSRVDLAIAYGLTGVFGIAVMIISAGVQPDVVIGNKMVLEVANYMGTIAGPVGKWCFLIGFWGAVFSSMLGVWQGIPYLFTDFVQTRKAYIQGGTPVDVDTCSRLYRGYLAYLSIPPMVLLLFGKPVWLVVVYAVAGAFFMPFLAGLLLYMNSRKGWLNEYKNGWGTNTLLTLSLLVFVGLFVIELLTRIQQ
ncbi:MAG: Nramp family divalent metal transporter [Gammaproteobacteria bacterium]